MPSRLRRGQPPSYFSPYKIPTLTDGPAGEYLTDREAAEAVRFITAHKDGPFLLYLPHYCVHTPIQGKKDVTAKYAAKQALDQEPRNDAYAAMVESVDDSLGRILATLDALGIRENTVIFFTSDNGGQVSVTDNRPLRAGKGSAYEGGVRVPFIVSLPGVTKPGSTCDTPVITPDIPATILAITGVDPNSTQPRGVTRAEAAEQVLTPIRFPRGITRAMEPALEAERSQDGETRATPSDRRAGCPKEASGDVARATPSRGSGRQKRAGRCG